jgi:protein TonB
MFEDSLFASSPLPDSRSRWPTLAAVAAQLALAALLLLIPLLHPELLPAAANRVSSITPPVLRAAVPPPPPQHLLRVTTTTVRPSFAPPAQRARIARTAIASDAPPIDAPALPFGASGKAENANLHDLISGAPAAPLIVVDKPGASGGPAHPFRISTGVLTGMLLDPIQVEYPQIARLTHTEGVVVVQAVISRTGHIESAHVMTGPAVLQAAALAAVERAQYRPFLLNGQPTEVETTISIHFKLGS